LSSTLCVANYFTVAWRRGSPRSTLCIVNHIAEQKMYCSVG
jgi:hypothetical protein